jgi:hypothetical protein
MAEIEGHIRFKGLIGDATYHWNSDCCLFP